MAEILFWQQFPEGTKDFAFSIAEIFTHAMHETEKEEYILEEIFGALGVAVGFILH